MKIIFIRHAEPDYIHDSLTEKGWKEAECLSKRIAKWNNITDFYVSPKGRAQDTCHTGMKELLDKATTYEWLREFSMDFTGPDGNLKRVPWDFYPKYWKEVPEFYDKDKWLDAPIYKDTEIHERFDEFKEGFDALLAKYGYKREGMQYRVDHDNDDTTIVIFCHLGITLLAMGYLTGISPVALWHGIYIAPSSVTILCSEEREPGYANFRAQVIGDTTHLHDGNEPISDSGFFTKSFQY